MKFKDDVIVIGSGIGGLSCAAYLAKKGYKVKIFERLNQTGGCMNTFKRKDYYFESSTHLVCGFDYYNFLGKSLNELGISKSILKNLDDSFNSFIYQNNKILKNFSIKSGIENATKSLLSYFPNEKNNIKKVFKDSKNASNDVIRVLRLVKSNPLFHIYDLITWIMFLFAKDGTFFKKIGEASYRSFSKNNSIPFSGYLNFINNEELKLIFYHYCFFEGNSPSNIPALIMLIVIYLLMYRKTQFIKNGTATLINSLINVIKENSGEIIYNSEVKKIIIENKKATGVVLSDNSEHKAKYIVSNAAADITYNNFITEKKVLPEELQKKVSNYKSSISGFQIFLGLPFDIRDYGYNYATNFFVHNIDIEKIFKDPNIKSDQDFTFVLTNYSAIDEFYAPKGKSSLVAFAYDNYDDWPERGTDLYTQRKTEKEKLFLKKIKELTALPLDKAEVCFSATPKTFKHYMGNSKGGFVGADANFDQISFNRFDQKSPVENLYLSGADTIPSGGIAASFDSGIIAAKKIMNSKN